MTEPSAVAGFFRLALNTLLPPQCMGCGVIVDGAGALCPPCWDKADFVTPPHCAVCGLSFEFDPGEGGLCGACARERPVYRRARTVMAYGEISRKLIIAFKHGDGVEAVPAFSRWLVRAGADLILDADLAAPVPLHWTRLFARRYNQAAMLALAVGRQTGIAVSPDLLVRRKRTRSQGGLGPEDRRRNMKGAFAVRPSMVDAIRGRNILLIDDVMTTGATVSACARTLLDAGAAAVDVLTLAMVMRPRY
ncbi:MAG: amidophosphoribosyltransferase [Rhodospirillales bacterium RIFCSPLOWO2_12_FULL_58_28]|nr:MAG: amidophosphoribosyltransferase [Rhodospirillales bacterium RIFCSPLOWO2_02_FULL_58_16]OHC78028.1 MAG: amidophosphoribosyltransferase [Rhodospirillales bacterium RIFCSPLOWO2_12_FULL_58_28]